MKAVHTEFSRGPLLCLQDYGYNIITFLQGWTPSASQQGNPIHSFL